MKTTQAQIFMDLLNACIDEALSAGDIHLTKNIMNDPVQQFRLANGPVCFIVGWDRRERYNVFSIN